MTGRYVSVRFTAAEASALLGAAGAGEYEYCDNVRLDPDATERDKTHRMQALERAMEKIRKALPDD